MYALHMTKINFLLLNFLIILVYSLIYYLYGDRDNFIINQKNQNKLTFIDSLYFSTVTYGTHGTTEYIPKSNFMKIINLTEIYVMISMLVLFIHIQF
jgi:hypothetical protein